MNILLISYGDLDYDGRLRSLLTVFNSMGEVYSFTRGSQPFNENSVVDNVKYIKFIKDATSYAKGFHQIDLLVLDNRKATIPGFLIKRANRPSIIVQDCRELYLIKEVKHLTGKIGCLFEKRMARSADVVICANQERAEIMRKEYGLSRLPLTYENLRRLEYSSADGKKNAADKLDAFIKDDEYRIVSSSGCSISRTNDVLVRNLHNVDYKCHLFLVGASDKEDEEIIRGLVNKNSDTKVTILGQLNQDELKYLIQRSHIGIVNYGQYDTNNRLCASGKLYEFLYEGKPVVTTTNPPLKRICETEGIGIADDEYASAINMIIDRYDEYKERVKEFIDDHTIDSNDAVLRESLQSAIESN